MGCGPDVEEAGWWAREVDAVMVVEVTVGEEQNENVWVVVAFGWVSWKHLHWLLRREALHFHSAQVVGIGSSQ